MKTIRSIATLAGLFAAVLTLGAIIYVSSLLIDVTSEGIDRANAFTSTPRIEVD